MALSLVLSESETCQDIIYCVRSDLVNITSKFSFVGRIYAAGTASFLLNYTNLLNSGELEDEILRK